MARIPIQQIETGPVIGPALERANRIREGRARAAITEETAKTYPQERRARLSVLEEQAEQAPMRTEQMGLETEGMRQKLEAFPRQQELSEEAQKLQNAGARLDVINKTLAATTSPEEYQRATGYLIEQGIAPAGGFDELPEAAQTPEGYLEYRNNVLIPELGVKQEELDARMRGYETQERVARIYANARQGNVENINRLDAKDRRIVESDLYDEYRNRYMIPVEVQATDQYGNPTTRIDYRLKENAPEYSDVKQRLFNEKVRMIEGRTGADWRNYR